VEYRRYTKELAHGRAAAALALLTALGACGREPARPVAQTPPPAPVQTGVASYYAKSLAGKPTASGEPHEPHALTAASRSLPLGTTAKVTNMENGRSVTVKVNDRGPYAKKRILDLSRRAAEHLGFKHDGIAKVAVQPVKATPPKR